MRKLQVGLGTLIVLGGVLAFGFYSFGWSPLHGREGARAATPAPAMAAMPVPVSGVVVRTIPIYLDYSARMESIRNIALQARIPGYLQAQEAPDGADVKAGELLYTIDPRDLQAALDQATAQAQRDSASLDYARANFGRGEQLVKSGYVTKDAFDQRESALRQGQAALVIDKAAIRTAQLTLSHAQIRAPFAGRLGRNQAPVGTLISVAGAALNTLVQLDPIYVTFNPSETELAEIEHARKAGAVDVDLLDPDRAQPLRTGKLTFLDNVVDKTTGTITARATVANSDFSLLPGEYVRVRLHVKEQSNALMVPQTAVGSSQLGQYLYVVGPHGKADQRLVTLGPSDGDLVSVVNGISAGDQIITGNLQKIGPGSPVRPLPSAQPPA